MPISLSMEAHGTNLSGTYNYWLVALSIVLAIGASYAALDLAGRVTAARRRARIYWLIGGSMAMGTGIWAMHYIGMLAFSIPMQVLYDLPTVAVSLLAAITASCVALFVVSRRTIGLLQEIVGSIVMGSGIAAMHYIGMMAMRVPAQMIYIPLIVALSVVLAMVISFVALVLAFRIRDEQQTSTRKVVSALVMGSAIPLMHYTGMAAVRFFPSGKPLYDSADLAHAVHISHLGTGVIGVTGFMVLVLAIATSFLDRLIATQRIAIETSRENAAHFRTMTEEIPQLIWTTGPNGEADYVNENWRRYTGLDLEATRAGRWQKIVHADDLPACLLKWERAMKTGETFETEYRLRRSIDNEYRWHLVRAIAIKDSKGSIVRWFGTCTDVHDQRGQQQILEEQVRERTAEVVAANTRMQEEMREREQAQDELNQQNRTMLDELTRRSARAVLLARMGKLLQSSSNMTEAIGIVLGLAPKIFPDFRGALYLFNASRSMLELAGSWAECELPETAAFEINCCWALRTGQRHFVEARDRTAPCPHANTVKGSYLCVPVMTQGGTAGILHLQLITNTREPFEAELLLTNSFAEQVGLSIANIKLQEALRQQSTRDALTGLYNRRYLEESMEREIRRAARSDQPVGIIMFDLDHFKTFNDTYGHEAGDSVLREVGSFLQKSVRAEDVPCRFGGEEFLLILPGADLEGTHSRAERLRSQVKQLSVMHQGKPLGVITISVGVAAFPGHGSAIKELIAAADGALYAAKRGGRDRVMAAEVVENTQVDLVASATASMGTTV